MDINEITTRGLGGPGPQAIAWYVRHEYGDCDPTWFLSSIRPKPRSANVAHGFPTLRRALRSLTTILF